MAMQVREKLNELMAASLPADFILKELVLRLIARTPNDEFKQRSVAMAAHFEHKLSMGSKAIFHLEAFVLHFMVACAKEANV